MQNFWVFSHAAEASILLGYDATALSNCFPNASTQHSSLIFKG